MTGAGIAFAMGAFTPGRWKREEAGIILRRDQIGPLMIALRKALHGTAE